MRSRRESRPWKAKFSHVGVVMAWLTGTYAKLHRGADSGTSDPEGWELYTGGQYPTWRQLFKPHEVNGADFQAAAHVYSRVPALGQAASLPPEIPGVPLSDRVHINALDGHVDSALSNHPDGRFAQNTAVTSDYSLGANYATFTGPSLAPGRLQPVTLPNYTINTNPTRANSSGIIGPPKSVTASQLSEQRMRAPHLQNQPELLVKAAAPGYLRTGSVLSREFTTPELGLGALGLYMAYSAFA